MNTPFGRTDVKSSSFGSWKNATLSLLLADENLLGLNYQLENESIKHLCDILMAVQSSYVKQFRALAEEIIHNVEETKSNIEFLNALVSPCNVSRIDGEAAEYQELFRSWRARSSRRNLGRFYRTSSTSFDIFGCRALTTTPRRKLPSSAGKASLADLSAEYMEVWRSLSNQIIRQCTQFIDMDIIFLQKHTKNAIKMFETCIQCLTDYIRTYVLVSGWWRSGNLLFWLE